MSRRLIIPFFIPFRGCPTICVFCDQKALTGASGVPAPEEIRQRIETYLGTWRGGGRIEVAFYGGTFTAMSEAEQDACLSPVQEFLDDGRIESIRVSTRPDSVDETVVDFLKVRGVATVELGAQSMDDRVLGLCNRGHSAEDTEHAMLMLKRAGLSAGVQLMPGLPGDDEATALRSARSVISLGPDFVRIYPTVVMKGTALERMYEAGDYRPWTMEEMVAVCAQMTELFGKAGIRIIRMGLQKTEDLANGLVAGPYHPAFRDLVKKHLQPHSCREDLK